MKMTENGEMLAQMWLAVKPYIDKKERADATIAFLRAAEDFVDLEGAREEASSADSSLSAAFAELLGETEEEQDDEYDEDY